jgi:hypothetical protein
MHAPIPSDLCTMSRTCCLLARTSSRTHHSIARTCIRHAQLCTHLVQNFTHRHARGTAKNPSPNSGTIRAMPSQSRIFGILIFGRYVKYYTLTESVWSSLNLNLLKSNEYRPILKGTCDENIACVLRAAYDFLHGLASKSSWYFMTLGHVIYSTPFGGLRQYY